MPLLHYAVPDRLETGCDEVGGPAFTAYHSRHFAVLERWFAAGRGTLMGPVVAGAVIIDPDMVLHPALNDSKKVTAKNRAIVQHWVEDNCLFGLGLATVQEIDQLNIQQASYLAMHRALQDMGIVPDHILIDGTGFLPYQIDGRTVPHSCVPQGDGKYASIAAASIIAKQHRDSLMLSLVQSHPELHARYGIGSNVGYGSAIHLAGINTWGPSPFHRMSFAPAKHWTPPDNQQNLP